MTKSLRLRFLLLPTFLASICVAFRPPRSSSLLRRSLSSRSLPFHQTNNQVERRSSSSSLGMCICIHCARVTNCSAYHFVEERHKQPHINKNPTWEPRNGSPTIQVHIRPDSSAGKELGRMWTEHEEETERAIIEAASSQTGSEEADPLFGSKQYDLTATTTYEYDVVECEDFIEDKDAWVKNMPQEIREANPHFVPS